MVSAVILTIASSLLLVCGSCFVLFSALAMHRARDAYTRVNCLSPATGFGMPMLVGAAFLYHCVDHGFEVAAFIKAAAAILALIIVSSVASNTLARAAYLSGAPVDERTSPQELAEEPAPEQAPEGRADELR